MSDCRIPLSGRARRLREMSARQPQQGSFVQEIRRLDVHEDLDDVRV